MFLSFILLQASSVALFNLCMLTMNKMVSDPTVVAEIFKDSVKRAAEMTTPTFNVNGQVAVAPGAVQPKTADTDAGKNKNPDGKTTDGKAADAKGGDGQATAPAVAAPAAAVKVQRTAAAK